MGNDRVYIYNLEQVYFYIENGIRPYEKPRVHKTTGNIFFCFDKKKSQVVYERWINNK